jgi:TIR domain-containing protein
VSAGTTEPGSMRAPKVFITYRREETAAYAGRLYDAMVSRFGEGNVFMDVDMAPGVDFVERITEAVAASHVLIVIMGPSWATVEDEHGKARLADPEDFVRLEVETALRRPNVTPIPVLVSGARMPKREDLPPEIQAITRRNALELSDQRWGYDIGRLIDTLDELLGGTDRIPTSPVSERGVLSDQAAPGSAATARAETSKSPTPRAGPSAQMKPGEPKGVRRLLRWPLSAAIATALGVIVAIIIAIVVWGGSSDQSGPDLSSLVLAPTEGPGDLVWKEDTSGDFDPQDEGWQVNPQAAYHNEFGAASDEAKPYWYSDSVAVSFEDEQAAQAALAELKGSFSQAGTLNADKVDSIGAEGLGDEGFGWLATGVGRDSGFRGSWEGSEYVYAWRTGELLQVFDLTLSGPGVSEDTAHSFAVQMTS